MLFGAFRKKLQGSRLQVDLCYFYRWLVRQPRIIQYRVLKSAASQVAWELVCCIALLLALPRLSIIFYQHDSFIFLTIAKSQQVNSVTEHRFPVRSSQIYPSQVSTTPCQKSSSTEPHPRSIFQQRNGRLSNRIRSCLVTTITSPSASSRPPCLLSTTAMDVSLFVAGRLLAKVTMITDRASMAVNRTMVAQARSALLGNRTRSSRS